MLTRDFMKLLNNDFNTHLQDVTIDILEDEKGTGHTLEAELPGVKKEEIDIRVEGDKLVIVGKTRKNPSKFQRVFRAPYSIDPEKVGAKLEDGVLTIHLTKKTLEQEKKILIN
jgi:HSP20 family protein